MAMSGILRCEEGIGQTSVAAPGVIGSSVVFLAATTIETRISEGVRVGAPGHYAVPRGRARLQRFCNRSIRTARLSSEDDEIG